MKKLRQKIWAVLMTPVNIPGVNFSKSRRMLRQETGSALMIAIFSVSLMIVIATEVMYDTSVEFVMSSKSVDQVKAYYAAKAGLEMSLLRIQIFKKAHAAVGDSLPDKSILDQIWQFPFAWPPLIPGVTNSQTKSGIDKVVKQSGMQSKYIATIESEGNKIDINDLASPSKAIAQAVHTQLLQLFAAKIKNDEAFAAEYASYDFEKLINNITDWVSDNPVSVAGGGDKKSKYSNLKSEFIPPSQPFKTLSELHMVQDMKDDFFNVLAPNITVFGDKAVNVNLASKEILMSLSPQITADRATEILKLKALPTRGPFKDQKDFLSALNTVGISGDPFTDPKTGQTVPLIFDSEFNFRVKSTGMSGKVSRTIEAVVYDYGRVKAGLQSALQTEKQANQQQQTGTPTPPPSSATSGAASPLPSPSASPQNQKIDVPNERPRVIYWEEN